MAFPQSFEKNSINPDLVEERKNATFSIEAMTEILYGEDYLKRLARIKKLMAHNPKLDLTDLWHVNKYDRYLRACERAEEIVRLARTYKLSKEDMQLVSVMVGEDFFLHLHLTMFIPTLESMADDEQQKEWLPLARDFRLFGTYAQTELGHGSNVPGLETTARFDPVTDEWVIDTPTLTATKWWPGGLAKSCTHCILMAQLVIGDKNYGSHPFFLPIRSLDTHESLPGVFLADIGQKLGYNGMDNGCMQLQGVRIPRRNLLMRYAVVERDGTYRKQGNQRMMYGAMTYTRKSIIMTAGPALAKAATIAVRYSAVRRQFSMKSPKEVAALIAAGQPVPEAAVLDYSSQLYMLLPLVAAAYAYSAASEKTSAMYDEMMARAHKGDFEILGETHIVTSALKSHLTMYAFDGIETCRKACGGHGFLTSSGLPGHLANFAPQPTYEGDFVVLSIQTGRALLKEVGRVMAGKPTPFSTTGSASYLTKYTPEVLAQSAPAATPADFTNLDWLVSAMARRASHLAYTTTQEFMQEKQRLNLGAMQALDHVKIDFTRLNVAHAQLLVMQAFVEKVRKICPKSKANERALMEKLCALYGLSTLDKHLMEFVQAQCVSVEASTLVLPELKKLLAVIRPNAVALVDAWAYPDYLLNSVLGRYDGRAYEALFDQCKFDANNKADVHESYFRSLQYILHPERKVQGSFMASQAKL